MEKVETKSREVLYSSLRNTVALLDDEGYTFCSGVMIKQKVLTAAHCTEAVTQFSIRYKGKEYPGVIMLTWQKEDLAVVVPAGLAPEDAEDTVSLADQAPYVGDQVYWFGYPSGIELVMGTGTIGRSHSTSSGVENKMVIFGQIIPGNSGGPVFNRKGQLVGIVSATMITRMDERSQDQFVPFGYVVHLDDIKKVSAL